MIIDHTHPLYAKKRNSMGKDGKYNGAYYYSREIVKNIIPNVIVSSIIFSIFTHGISFLSIKWMSVVYEHINPSCFK